MDKIKTLEERFWEKVDIQSTGDCWNWLGAKNSGNYGVININRKMVYAHRLSYELHFDKIPDRLVVGHKCDNPRCVNPQHLFLGTQQDNILDKIQKGRNGSPLGEKSHLSKLKLEDVLVIKNLLSGKTYYDREIAEMFGVTTGCIQGIKQGHTWAWVK